MRPPLHTCAPVPMQTINTRFKPAHNRLPNQTQSPSRSPPPHAPHQPNDIYFSPRHLEITITKKAQSTTTTTPHDQTTQPTTKLNRTHIPPHNQHKPSPNNTTTTTTTTQSSQPTHHITTPSHPHHPPTSHIPRVALVAQVQRDARAAGALYNDNTYDDGGVRRFVSGFLPGPQPPITSQPSFL